MLVEDVRRLFTEIDGVLVWKERPISDFKSKRDCQAWNTRFAGTPAGYFRVKKNNDNRCVIGIKGKLYQRAHLIWLLHKGSLPPSGFFIDHKNRNSLDDKFSNLRLATCSQNNSNRGTPSHNTSGRKGVHWNKQSNKWLAKIKIKGKVIYLGFFDNLDKAGEAYVNASKKYFGEFSGVA